MTAPPINLAQCSPELKSTEAGRSPSFTEFGSKHSASSLNPIEAYHMLGPAFSFPFSSLIHGLRSVLNMRAYLQPHLPHFGSQASV